MLEIWRATQHWISQPLACGHLHSLNYSLPAAIFLCTGMLQVTRVDVQSAPDICHFGYTTELFRPVTSTPKKPKFASKWPKSAQIGQTVFLFFPCFVFVYIVFLYLCICVFQGAAFSEPFYQAAILFFPSSNTISIFLPPTQLTAVISI